MSRDGRLVLTLRVGESVTIGAAKLTVLRVERSQVRVSIDGPEPVGTIAQRPEPDPGGGAM
jgi:carbon storage regulator CsrA